MYKLSYYLIEHKNENEVVLFSTRTGKWIHLSDKQYQTTIIKGDFSDLSLVAKLKDIKILVPIEEDEFDLLRRERRVARKKTNNLPVSNFVITPTMDCNARCFYCFEHTACHDIHMDSMNEETAKNVANFILDKTQGESFTIHWFGGEPLMRTDIIDIISDILNAAGAKYITNITTNGYYVDQPTIEKMKTKWHVHLLKVTVDDIGEKYNKIKNYRTPCVDDPFTYVMTNLKSAVDNGINVRIRANYNPLETELIDRMNTFMTEWFEGNPNIHFHFVAIDSNSKKIPALSANFKDKKTHPYMEVLDREKKCETRDNMDKYDAEERELAKKFTPWCNIRSTLITDDVSKVLADHYLMPVPFNCLGVCDNSLAIDSHGDIYVCHRLLGQGKEVSSGNVNDGIINNEIYRYFQSTEADEEECKKCNLLPLCGGGCKYKRMNYKNNHHIPIKGAAEEALVHALDILEQ